jgi:hypothetical protein
MDDTLFDGIREDVRLFGSWSLLLVVADMAYPSPAYIPRTVPKVALSRLIECGLVEQLTGHRFRIRGMVKERDGRSGTGRNAAEVRWQNERNANALPSKAKQEHKQSTDARDSDDPAWLVAWWQIGRRRPPTAGQQKVINDFLRAFDVTGEKRLTRLFLDNPTDPIGAAMEDLRVFREKAKADAKADEDESAKRHAERKRSSGVDPKLRAWMHGEDVA